MTEEYKRELTELGADVNGAIARMVDNEALYASFLRTFPDDTSPAEIKRAIAAKNSRLLLEAAHRLKGVSANLGLNNISGPASCVTDCLRHGGDTEAAKGQGFEACRQFDLTSGVILKHRNEPEGDIVV